MHMAEVVDFVTLTWWNDPMRLHSKCS